MYCSYMRFNLLNSNYAKAIINKSLEKLQEELNVWQNFGVHNERNLKMQRIIY